MKTDLEATEFFNFSIGNILINFEINQYSNFDSGINNVKNPTSIAVLSYKHHSSNIEIQSKCKNRIKFACEEMDLASIETEILNLKINKVSQSSDIVTKIIKEKVDIFAEFLRKIINSSIKSPTFPSSLKWADVTPLYIKLKKDCKDNYRPISILLILSKCFENGLPLSTAVFHFSSKDKRHC